MKGISFLLIEKFNQLNPFNCLSFNRRPDYLLPVLSKQNVKALSFTLNALSVKTM